MLENSSEELKTLVLLEFTRTLIIGTSPTVFLKERQRPIRKTKKEKFREIIKSKIPQEIKTELPRPITSAPTPTTITTRPQPSLKVPETRLPSQFAYLRPYATTEIELDLGKLNPLLADPGVSVIESNGPDQQIIVRGRMGTKPTGMILTKEEIDKIIQTFSEKSKIPVGEGATKIVLGKFMLSAIISQESGSRFILKKIPPTPPNQMIPRR